MDPDEYLRQALMEVVMSTSLIPSDQRKLIVQELAKINIKDQSVKEQLKVSFGSDSYENAVKIAQAKAAAAAVLQEPVMNNEKQFPKILCTGGDVAGLAGVDISAEFAILERMRNKLKQSSFPIISPSEVIEAFPFDLPTETALAIARVVNSVITLVVRKGSKSNILIRKSSEREDSLVSVFNHPSLCDSPNLRTWGLKALLLSVHGNKGKLASLWEGRIIEKIQNKVLSG